MSEVAEMYRARGDHKKRLRTAFARACPECQRLLPKANPSLLLPQQQCRIHRYRDPRPELTDEQWNSV